MRSVLSKTHLAECKLNSKKKSKALNSQLLKILLTSEVSGLKITRRKGMRHKSKDSIKTFYNTVMLTQFPPKRRRFSLLRIL